LRRRDLIDRFIAGNKVGDEVPLVAQNARGRMGAYWGIDTDVNKIDPADALPCDPTITHKLGAVATRLSDLGGETSKQLVNWGYAVCDRSIRSNYKGPIDDVKPDWPFPDARLG
jgi:NTE family protein